MALLGHVGKSEDCRLEIGCGHGHAMDAVARAIGGCWTGIDISDNAVQKARTLYPAHRFFVADILAGLPFPPSSVGKFDVVIMSQMLWYVLGDLDKAVRNCIRLTRMCGLFVISQAFLRQQLYGREVIEGFDGALRYLFTRFPQLRLIEAQHDDTNTHIHHDGLLIFRKVGTC